MAFFCNVCVPFYDKIIIHDIIQWNVLASISQLFSPNEFVLITSSKIVKHFLFPDQIVTISINYLYFWKRIVFHFSPRMLSICGNILQTKQKINLEIISSFFLRVDKIFKQSAEKELSIIESIRNAFDVSNIAIQQLHTKIITSTYR